MLYSSGAFLLILFYRGGAFEGGPAEAVVNAIGHCVQLLLFFAALAVKEQSLPAWLDFQAAHAQTQQA